MQDNVINLPHAKFETEKKFAIYPSEYALEVSDLSRIIYNNELIELANIASMSVDNLTFKIIDDPIEPFQLPNGNLVKYRIGLKIGDKSVKHTYPAIPVRGKNPPKEIYEYHVPTYAIVKDQQFYHYYPLNKINIY